MMQKLIILLLFISSGLYSQKLEIQSDSLIVWSDLDQTETSILTVDRFDGFVQVRDTIEGVLVFINDWENPELIVSKAYCVRNRYVLSDAFYYSIDNDYFFIRNKEYEFIDNDVVVTEGDIIIHIENSRIVNWLPKL
jgi:hypothetical protein